MQKITKEAKDNLMDKFVLSDKQAEAILEMKLRRLTSLEVEKIENELKEIEKAIAYYREILGSESKTEEIIISELEEIKKKYSIPRRTELVKVYESLELEDLIEEEDVVISVSPRGIY